MSNSNPELDKMSALIDDQLDPVQTESALDALADDEASRRFYRDALLIRDVVQAQYQAGVADRLSRRMRVSMASEPAHRAVTRTSPVHSGTRLAPVVGQSPFSYRRGTRTGAALALAASVVLATVLVLFPKLPDESGGSPGGSRTPNPEAFDTGVAQVDATHALPEEVVRALERARQQQSSTLQTAAVRWNSTGEVEQRLNGYLLSHNAYLSSSPRGMLPYARIVGYGQDNPVR